MSESHLLLSLSPYVFLRLWPLVGIFYLRTPILIPRAPPSGTVGLYIDLGLCILGFTGHFPGLGLGLSSSTLLILLQIQEIRWASS